MTWGKAHEVRTIPSEVEIAAALHAAEPLGHREMNPLTDCVRCHGRARVVVSLFGGNR